MSESIRRRTEETERKLLSPYAALSEETKGRERPEEPCPIRTEYQRDRDRILHCNAYRRLMYKTQVFLCPMGDHYRTRLTHTLEVAQIARTLARALRLNEDLTEAIALGHDLGHTPFGHAGERMLDSLLPGGFRHYRQSVRTVERLEKNGQGLNLTWETRNGILHHTEGEQPAALEGQLVRLSDKIAYLNHDIEDAVRAEVLKESDLPRECTEILGKTKSERITALVTAVLTASEDRTEIGMEAEAKKAFEALGCFMREAVYTNPTAKSEEGKAAALVAALYEYVCGHPEALPEWLEAIREEEGIERAACDYIAGMSDRYAVSVYNEHFVPKFWR